MCHGCSTFNGVKMIDSCIRVAIFDDHPLMRDGITWALESERDVTVVGSGKLSDAALLATTLRPSLIVIGVNAPGSGLVTARRLASSHPNIPILILTVSERYEDARAALEAGVRGYALKSVPSRDLVDIVRTVVGGEIFVAPDLAVRLLVMPTMGGRWGVAVAIRNLSDREKEILDGVALGMTNKEIATRMALSERSIKHYMTGVMRKLNARNRVEASLMLRRSVSNESQGLHTA